MGDTIAQAWGFLEQYLPAILTFLIGWSAFKITKIVKALKELGEFLTTISVALSDQEITKEELKEIRKEGIEALAAFKAIFKK